jgi:hypothetical protein
MSLDNGRTAQHYAIMKIHPLLLLILFAAVISGLLLEYRSLVGLRAENDSLRQQLARLQSEYEQVSRPAAQAADSQPDTELLRLRAEVTSLHDQLKRQAAKYDQDHVNSQAPQQTVLPAFVTESNNMVAWLNRAAGPDALSRGTVSLITNKSGRTGWEYNGFDSKGLSIKSFRWGPTNQ